MKKSKLMKKFLTICVTTLFFTVISTSVSSINNYSPLKKSLTDPPMPQIEGTLGNNSWYISDVYISFIYDPKIVDEIGYYINDVWHEYTGDPILVSEEGEYIIPWYWIDEDGFRHDMFPLTFQIDKTQPTIKLTKYLDEINNEMSFNATCSDSISDISFVEFYVDDELIKTISEEPYIYFWEGSGKHLVYAICHDFAGHTEQSETLDTTPRSRSYNFQLLDIFLQRLSNIILLIQQIILN
jgi:hypothetical protein